MSVPIASPVYTLGLWQGNVTDDSGIDWIVEGEDGWSSSPPVRPLTEDKVAGDGSWSGPGSYAARVIGLTGKALAPDRVSMLQAKERIKAAVSPRGLTVLQVDEAHLSRMTRVRLSDIVQITDYGANGFQWSLILVAPDPRRYSVDAPPVWTGLPSTTTTGRTYTESFPVLYGGGDPASSGTVLITQYGNYDNTPAVIVFSGPVITPQVAHLQTGRSMTFDIELLQGETLVVDLAAKSVLLNGTASRASALTTGSAWFWLTPGENELQFRGQAGPSSDGTTPLMTVTAASAWT